MAKITDSIKRILESESVKQFIRYIFVGGISFAVNFAMLYIFHDILQINKMIANVLSNSAGIVVNYCLSRKFVFTDSGMKKRYEFLVYIVISIVGIGLDTLLFFIISDVWHVYYLIAKIITTAMVFIWNFGARRALYVLFDKREGKQ